MKSNLRAILVAVIALALCLTALMPAALADSSVKATVTLHNEIQLRGGSIPSVYDHFYLRLTPLDSNCPMPMGYAGKPYEVEVVGYARKIPVDFPPINFTELGIYHYKITLHPKKINKRLAYDTRYYDVTVSVFNGENGVESAVAMRLNGEGDKTDLALFVNRYDTTPGTITPTGVSENWPWLVAGSLALLIAAGFVFRTLRKKKGGAQ